MMIETVTNLAGEQLPLVQTYAAYARTLYHNTYAGFGLQQVGEIAKEEALNASIVGKTALVGFGGLLGFEQLGGNESAIGKTGGVVLRALNENPFVETAAVGVATAITSIGIQAPLAVLSATCVGMFPDTIDKYQEWFGRNYTQEPGKVKQFVTDMTIGSAAAVIGKSFKNPDLDFWGRLREGFKSVKHIAEGVLGIGVIIGGANQALEQTGHPEIGHAMVNIVTNPLPWIGTFGTINYLDWRKNKVDAHQEEPQPEPTKLPESISSKITKPRAWGAVALIGALSRKETRKSVSGSSPIKNAVITSAVKYLNKKRTLNIPK